MKKKVILLSLILGISMLCFMPVSLKKTVTIKAEFLTTYSQLANGNNWENWMPDLIKAVQTDSDKISIKKDTASFVINYTDLKVNAKLAGSLIKVNEQNGDKTINYSYSILPGNLPKQTIITVRESSSFINYLLGKEGQAWVSDTHIADLKKFMETDSLYYGRNIFKLRVPQENLIEIKRTVLARNRFKEASEMLALLKLYVKTSGVKQMYPLIAQFLPKGKDSTQLNVGFFINKEVKSGGGITYVRMPKGGPFYAAKFHGEFNKRQEAYASLQQYFTDHRYQQFILPIEIYLDDKLPASDTDRVNIQVNFSAYY